MELKGLEEMQRALAQKAAQIDGRVKQVVQLNGAELNEKMQRKAEFKGHYEWKKGTGKVFVKPSGNLKRSIRMEIRDGGYTAAVGPHEEYAEYVEYGTRHMEAQPYIKPAYDAQKPQFKSDLKKAMGK